MNKVLLTIRFAAVLSAPARADNCADLGLSIRFCDQSGATEGQTTNSQSNAGSNQTTR
jgi:hypothetical protein